MLKSFLRKLREFFIGVPISVSLSDFLANSAEREKDRVLEHPKFQNTKRLEPFGYKVYSQNDEDGIINEIFKRIGTTDKRFVEFGVGNGLENNTHFLLFQGWSGLWIEGGSESCLSIKQTFDIPMKSDRLTLKNNFIDAENINQLIGGENSDEITGEIDLLSVDIDGNDYYVFDAINIISPRVVVIEYNAKFPPNIDWKMQYDKNHIWDGSDKQGASLKALELLLAKKGYQLVGTNIGGVNAFFVRSDLTKDNFCEPATSENLYNPFRFPLLMTKSGHPAKHFLGY